LVKRATLALVGSESLLGREIRDIISTASPELSLRLIAADEEEPGTLTRVGDEPAVVSGLEAGSLTGAQAVFLAGSADSSRKALQMAGGAATIIDLTYTHEEHPEARLRAPLVESETGAAAGVQVIAHPAAVALALFLRRTHAHYKVRRSVIQIFGPASDRGMAGLEELQQQTVNLLAFKSLPHAVFDTQLSFNLLARYGDEAPVALEETELRIERHLASLLSLTGEGAGVPMPSLRLIQAPVFHGYSISAWVEFEAEAGLEELERVLAGESIDVRSRDLEPPTIVGQAGQGGIAIGGIRPDRNHGRAYWFWMVADNIRLMAENAVAVAEQAL
jgi:aspartate-semialdehyde dehydrogenase